MSELDTIVAPDPPLSDGVITLRAFRTTDIVPLHAHLDDDAVRTYLSVPLDQDLEGTARFVTSRHKAMEDGFDATFAITDAVTGELLGSVGAKRSLDDPAVGAIGYWLFAPARGRGLMTRAVVLLAPWAFTAMELSRLEIRVHETNLASQHVAENAGFQREGVLRSIAEQHGRRVDLIMFARLATDPPVEGPGR